MRFSGRSRSASGRLVVKPCSASTRQNFAADCTPARARSAWTGTPSNVFPRRRSEEHTSELQSRSDLVCRLLLEKKKKKTTYTHLSKRVARTPRARVFMQRRPVHRM